MRRLQFEVEHWSSPQVELLGCLTAHVLARSNDELRPVIFNDFQAVEHLLDSVLGLRPFKRADRFTPLPQLFDLIEAMGDEVDYVHVHWLPRCSTPALKLVDSLVDRRLRDEREAPEVWSELTFDDLLIKAKGISA
ncbi:hypothetical protein [Streptomyces sp. V3I8]|uniref:hypothetical protein n=1 Tax=Streptomyces sp. V3I8 TaxID=3042279 RepID=UPI0027D8507C|nr:hypothetical protein [Streptomyces sp. V3I8]